ncbi:hypothetical protein B0A53_02286 [Rhodotorula sp. CCFEE 5036]|nr:hypothetical protein B0A53_02286 [Rhodotorula sp. CCFEE 5036]
MAASVSTPAIRAAYASLLDPDGDINWLIVGQTPPTNRLELVDQGADGLTELRRKLLPGRSLHGLLNVEGRVLFWSQIPDELTGVKRARALVQARHVASLLPHHDATVTFAAPIDLEPALVAIKLFHQHPQNSPTIRVESPHTIEGRRPSVPESLHALAPRPSLEQAEKQHPYISHRAADVQKGEAGYLSASAAPPSTMSSHLSPNSIPLHGLAISAIPSPPVSPAYPPPRPETEPAQPSTSSPPGVLDSAAAAMLVSSPSDSSIALSLQEVPIDIGEDELTSRRSTMQVFASQAVSTRGLGISGQPDGFRASVYPTDSPLTAEPDEVHNRESVLAPPIPPLAEDNDFTPPSTVESDLETTSSVKDVEGPSGPAAVDAKEGELRQRQADEAAAAERTRAAAQAEYDERQRSAEEEEGARLAAEAERQRIAEEARIREEAEAAERVRRAEEEAAAAAAEAARIEDERREAERLRLAQEEEEQRRAEARRKELEERKARLLAARDAGEVMLCGSVNVQANDSVLWKRRFFELTKTQLNLYKSETEPDDILITISVDDISRLTTNPEEALVPHSFKLRLRDGGGFLFYYNTAEETERLVEALRCAIER